MQRHMILAMLLIATLILGACGSGTPEQATTPASGGDTPPASGESNTDNPAASNEPVTITFGILEFQRQTYEPLIDAFQEEHPNITIQIVALDKVFGLGSDEQPKIEAMMGKIVRAADTAIPLVGIRPEDISQGYLYDLKPLMDADPNFEADDYYANALEVEDDGGIYQLPYQLPVPVLSYNKERWLSSGLAAPDPDWTWNDLVAASEQMAEKRGDTVDVYGLMDGGSGFLALFYELDAAGVDLFGTPIEELRLDTPEIEGVLEHMASMANNGTLYIPVSESGIIQFSPAEARQLVLDQRVGIWSPNVLAGGGGDTPEPSFEVGTVPFPVGTVPNFFLGNAQGYIMSGGTQHPQEAWQWLSFLSRQDVSDTFGQAGSITRIPARKSLAEKSGYWDEMDEETAEAVRAALSRPQPSMPAGLSTLSIQTVFETLQEAMVAVIAGNKTPTVALQDAQTDLNERVAEAQLTPEPTVESGPIVVATPEPVQTAPPESTQVTFGTLWFGADDVRDMAKQFQQQNSGMVVNVNNIGSAGSMPEFDDVVDTNDCFTWFGNPDEEQRTSLLDMQPLMDADASFARDDYPDAFFVPFQDGAALYALPYAVDFRVVSYNQTMFDAIGLAYPTVDWTMDDLVNAAQQLDQGEGADRQYGFVSFSPTSDIVFFLDRAGVSYVQGSDDTLQPNFTDPLLIETVQAYINLLRDFSPQEQLQGYRRDAPWDNEPVQLAFDGRVGMWFTTGGMFFGQGQEFDFTRAIAPPPLGTSDVTANDFHVRGLYISANADRPDVCWSWFKFISTETTLLQGSFPARLSVMDSPEFEDRADPGAMEVFTAYRDALSRSSRLRDEIPDRETFDTYWFYRAIDRALQGEDLERELAAAQEITAQFLTCVQTGEEASVCAPQVDPDYQGYNTPDEEETDG